MTELEATGTAGPKLRADARRNRARILEAAERVFADRGATASTEEIARAAGVGAGTLFRHFPTKEDLLQAVFVARMNGLAEKAGALARAEDPDGALTAFFRLAVAQADTKNAFAGMLASAGVDVRHATAEARRDLRRALGALLAGAQNAGTARRELRVEDLIALLAGASRAVEYADRDVRSRDRILAVILDGIRPPASNATGIDEV
jgi:AcrR family transcriptional regulator